jgi:hypothetical protein
MRSSPDAQSNDLRMPQPVQPAQQSAAIAAATQAFAQGRLDLADRICRELHEVGWDHWQSWLIVAQVAVKVARRDVAENALARSAACPGADTKRLDAVRALIAALHSGPDDPTPSPSPSPSPSSDRVLVVRSWSQGFWSDVDHVLGQLLLAEITGRTPLVHWGANSRFGGPQLPRGKNPGESDPAHNLWNHFFKPVSGLTLADVRRDARGITGTKFFPSKWNESNLTVIDNGAMAGPQSRLAGVSFLNRPEPVAVSDFHTPVMALRHWLPREHRLFGQPLDVIFLDLIAKYLIPSDAVAARLNDLATGMHTPTIAVHVRGSDKHVELPQLDQASAVYHQHISALMQKFPGARVRLFTDWQPAVAEYKAKYADRLDVADATRTSARTGLHYQPALIGTKLGEEVLLDTLLAARCDAFVGLGYSNVSAFMKYFGRLGPKKWTDETALLLGPHLHYVYNPGLLMPR